MKGDQPGQQVYILRGPEQDKARMSSGLSTSVDPVQTFPKQTLSPSRSSPVIMITSADIRLAAIQFFSGNLDCSSLDPAKALEFLANEQSIAAGSHDDWADGLDTALTTVKGLLDTSNIETFGAEKFRDQVVQVWLARAFCYFAGQIATKLEQNETLAQPYCEMFSYARGLIEDRNSTLRSFCASVHHIANYPLFQEPGWKCPEEELADLAKDVKTLRSYTWERFETTFEIPHDSGSTYSFDVDGVSGMSNWDIRTAIELLIAEESKRKSTCERGNPSETSMSMEGTDPDGAKSNAATTTRSNASSGPCQE